MRKLGRQITTHRRSDEVRGGEQAGKRSSDNNPGRSSEERNYPRSDPAGQAGDPLARAGITRLRSDCFGVSGRERVKRHHRRLLTTIVPHLIAGHSCCVIGGALYFGAHEPPRVDALLRPPVQPGRQLDSDAYRLESRAPSLGDLGERPNNRLSYVIGDGVGFQELATSSKSSRVGKRLSRGQGRAARICLP